MARISVPGSTLLAAVTFAGACALWGVTVATPDPAKDFQSVPVCSSSEAYSQGENCRQDFPATIAQTRNATTTHPSNHDGMTKGPQIPVHWVSLIVLPATAQGPDLQIADADWQPFNPHEGDKVTATMWDGKVIAVANERGKFGVMGAYPNRAYPLIFLSGFLLAVTLAVGAVGRQRGLDGWRRRCAKTADRALVPLTVVAVVVFYAHRSIVTVWGVVLLGTFAGAGYLSAATWRVIPEWRSDVLPSRRQSERRDRAAAERPLPAEPGLVGAAQKRWIGARMLRCAEWFGEAGGKREIVLPSTDVLRWYKPTPERTEVLWRSICLRMGVEYETLRQVKFLGVDVGDAVDFTAAIARTIARDRVIDEGHVGAEDPEMELTADLAAIYLGYGVITANAGFGPLTDGEFCYALAWLAHFRRERSPKWASGLDPALRSLFEQSMELVVNRPTVPTGTAQQSRP